MEASSSTIPRGNESDSDDGEFQSADQAGLNSGKPTETFNGYWIQAINRTGRNNQRPGQNCGKWLIFEPPASIDNVWATIKQETEAGELGFAAKVSTMKDKGERNQAAGNSDFVICVYTYDHEDETDVMRVRERLRNLGFASRKLPYKTDAATYAGEYKSTTNRRVSKYYC